MVCRIEFGIFFYQTSVALRRESHLFSRSHLMLLQSINRWTFRIAVMYFRKGGSWPPVYIQSQAMLDEVAPNLKIGVPMLSETVRADAREGDIGMQLGDIAKGNPAVAISSCPFFDPQHGANTNVVLRTPRMHISSRRPNARSRTCWSECGEHNHVAEARPLTAKTGVRVL